MGRTNPGRPKPPEGNGRSGYGTLTFVELSVLEKKTACAKSDTESDPAEKVTPLFQMKSANRLWLTVQMKVSSIYGDFVIIMILISE